MGLDAAITALTKSPKFGTMIIAETGEGLLPAQRKLRGRHDLDKVHVVVVGIVGLLMGVVQRIQVVVRPGHVLHIIADPLDHIIW